MSYLDNPVGRLHAILVKAKAYPGDKAALTVWGEVLGVDPSDHRNFIARYTQLFELVQDSIQAVNKVQNVRNRSIYLRPFEALDKIFIHTALAGNWVDVSKYLSDAMINGLEMAADLVSVQSGETIISDEELKELQLEAETLIDKVLEVNFPEDVKAILTEMLDSFRSAVIGYQIGGAERLQKAVESGVFTLYRNREKLVAEQKESDEKEATIDNIMKYVERANKVIEVALKFKELAPIALTALLGPGS
jgi:hypothetical protein